MLAPSVNSMQFFWRLQTLVAEMRFTFKVTGKAHFIKEDFSCNIKVYI